MKLTNISTPTHETVLKVEDRSVDLTGFIAVHSTELGPAAGGLRMRPYASEADALEDVLRLSRGMTYKNAAAGLPLGGGKAVIIGDPGTLKTPELLRSFARAIDSLSGRYWTAEDMGMSPADMQTIAEKTRFVAGLADGAHASGDPSPVTARGVFNALRETARRRFGNTDLTDRHVAVQGLGHVGFHLCHLLHQAGARLTVADIDETRVSQAAQEFGAKVASVTSILTVEADIFAPCAIGAILNADSIAQLRVSAVAGAANNQLATPEDGARLHTRGILFAPDFVANGGGIINVASEILAIENQEVWVAEKLEALGTTLARMFDRAEQRNCSPNDVAVEIVDEMLAPKAA